MALERWRERFPMRCLDIELNGLIRNWHTRCEIPMERRTTELLSYRKRKEMMQSWADYLDGFRSPKDIVSVVPKSDEVAVEQVIPRAGRPSFFSSRVPRERRIDCKAG